MKLLQFIAHTLFYRGSVLPTLALLAAPVCFGGSLEVRVTDASGHSIPQVVIMVRALGVIPPVAPPKTPAVMDQLNKAFEPRILLIPMGATVVFPNSDSVAHQVYSFSPTKQFALGLYRGQLPSPVLFDKPGIVVLGCNIHDSMVGYIVVTDASYFGMSDERGLWHSDETPSGKYSVSIWSPRFAEREASLQQQISIDSDTANVAFHLTQRLRAMPGNAPKAGAREY